MRFITIINALNIDNNKFHAGQEMEVKLRGNIRAKVIPVQMFDISIEHRVYSSLDVYQIANFPRSQTIFESFLQPPVTYCTLTGFSSNRKKRYSYS